MVSIIRLALALVGLLAIAIDPAQPDHFVAATYAVLSTYVIYCACIYVIAKRSEQGQRFLYAHEHWIDIAWYTVLVSLSSGTNSIFFLGFVFSILIAAFYRGLRAAYAATIASFALFSAAGAVAMMMSHGLEVNRFLTRAAVLLCFGFLIGQWGDREARLRRQLALLGCIGPTCNARLGCDRTIGMVLNDLRELYDADECVLVSRSTTTDSYQLRRAVRDDVRSSLVPQMLDKSRGDHFLALPDGIVDGRTVQLKSDAPTPPTNLLLLRPRRGRTLSVAVPDTGGLTSRVLLHRTHCLLRAHDVRFVRQVFEKLRPVTETIRLIDRVVLNARDDERARIARDIHDVLIQPLVAVRMALGGVVNRMSNDGHALMHADLDALEEIAASGVADLREYVAGLQGCGNVQQVDLLDSIRTLASRVECVTGMAIDVVAEEQVVVTNDLAEETQRIVWEGLSNAWRHASSETARVHLAVGNGSLSIEIENGIRPDREGSRFTPRSIFERAQALGGTIHVGSIENGNTLISVQVPL